MGVELCIDEFCIFEGSEYVYCDYDIVDGVSIYLGLNGGVGSVDVVSGM